MATASNDERRLIDHPEWIDALPDPTPDAPWRVLVSGCMLGWACGVDATDYGMGGARVGEESKNFRGLAPPLGLQVR